MPRLGGAWPSAPVHRGRCGGLGGAAHAWWTTAPRGLQWAVSLDAGRCKCLRAADIRFSFLFVNVR